MSEIPRLVDRFPQPNHRQLLASMVPPPRFADVAFATYRPDPRQPSQAAAVVALTAFAQRMCQPAAQGRLWWRRAPTPPEYRCGVYLDGPFGVGKTHLLASLWYEVAEPKVFCTFVELTLLVEAMGLQVAVDALADGRLLCIDDVELDDHGDAELITALLTRLTELGVSVAATSDSLPPDLEASRYSADDFLREMKGLAVQFDVFHIDGDDFCRRTAHAPISHSNEELETEAATKPGVVLDDFGALMAHLAALHPSRYGALLQDVTGVYLRGVHVVEDPAVGRLFAVFVDRLYDRSIHVMASGTPLDQVFADELLRSDHRKKYLRAIARLRELAQ